MLWPKAATRVQLVAAGQQVHSTGVCLTSTSAAALDGPPGAAAAGAAVAAVSSLTFSCSSLATSLSTSFTSSSKRICDQELALRP